MITDENGSELTSVVGPFSEGASFNLKCDVFGGKLHFFAFNVHYNNFTPTFFVYYILHHLSTPLGIIIFNSLESALKLLSNMTPFCILLLSLGNNISYSGRYLKRDTNTKLRKTTLAEGVLLNDTFRNVR